MTHHDIDPSLCAEPLLESLDDGFSPPERARGDDDGDDPAGTEPGERTLGPKSPF